MSQISDAFRLSLLKTVHNFDKEKAIITTKLLIDQGISIAFRDENDFTPMSWVIKHDNAELYKYFESIGAPMYELNPIHLAVSFKAECMIGYFLQNDFADSLNQLETLQVTYKFSSPQILLSFLSLSPKFLQNKNFSFSKHFDLSLNNKNTKIMLKYFAIINTNHQFINEIDLI